MTLMRSVLTKRKIWTTLKITFMKNFKLSIYKLLILLYSRINWTICLLISQIFSKISCLIFLSKPTNLHLYLFKGQFICAGCPKIFTNRPSTLSRNLFPKKPDFFLKLKNKIESRISSRWRSLIRFRSKVRYLQGLPEE